MKKLVVRVWARGVGGGLLDDLNGGVDDTGCLRKEGCVIYFLSGSC